MKRSMASPKSRTAVTLRAHLADRLGAGNTASVESFAMHLPRDIDGLEAVRFG